MQRLFLCISIALLCFVSLDHFFGKKNDRIIGFSPSNSDVIRMPLVEDKDPITANLWWGAPQEDRGPEFRRFLSVSLKISVQGAAGSGTIVYFDQSTGEAYIASCGHLWSGNRTADEVKRSPVDCKVITWYKNDVKLQQPQEYPAQVLFWSNTRGYDCSLLKFKPDWVPNYFPIAPLDYAIPAGSHQHSVGCDGAREVAHYDVEIVGPRGDDLITTKNSPRPGRSGGGLLSDDGYYIATCWGTSDTTGGGGIGYFTPLSSIYSIYKSNGYGWICGIDNFLAQKIPVLDRNNPQGTYNKNYVPIPNSNSFLIPR